MFGESNVYAVLYCKDSMKLLGDNYEQFWRQLFAECEYYISWTEMYQVPK